MDKKNIAVFFGGKSPEHDVSIVSALVSVVKPLELLGYEVVPVYIARNGKWFTGDELKDIRTYQGGRIDEIVAGKPVMISFDGGLELKESGLGKKPVKIDMAFPVMHGTYGEDGSLMGVLRMAGVPFAGSDMEASVVAMNKVLAKQVAEASGVKTPKYLSFLRSEFEADKGSVVRKVSDGLRYPVFVKPPHLGSSIGITKVESEDELENALEVALHYDDFVLVEEGVENLIEVTLPIIGGGDELELGYLERPLVNSEDFFDFETKYMGEGKKGGSKAGGKQGAQGYSEVPARLPEELYRKAEAVAVEVYRKVGMSGISRIDLLIDEKTEEVYFNEINPMPGSLYAHNFAKAGISNVDLVKKLLTYAEEDFAERERANSTFETSYLKKF